MIGLEIILRTRKTNQQSVIRAINRAKKKFTHVKKIDKRYDVIKKTYHVVVIHNKLIVSKEEEKKIQKAYEKLKHVSNVSIIQVVPDDFRNNIREKTDCHFFFDIDSTLTSGAPGIMAKGVKSVFNKLKEHDYWIHFASGRSDGDVQDLIVDYETEPQAIAENGGIIILSKTQLHYHGKIDQPDAAFAALKNKFKTKVRQDVKQGSRVTERIILNNIKQADCDKCVKPYGVKILASKTAYHIVQKHVDKGTAIRKLAKLRKWSDDVLVIGVGDSDLDIPMFKESDYSFAVSNASKKAQESASATLDNSYLDGVKEMYETWFKN